MGCSWASMCVGAEVAGANVNLHVQKEFVGDEYKV